MTHLDKSETNQVGFSNNMNFQDHRLSPLPMLFGIFFGKKKKKKKKKKKYAEKFKKFFAGHIMTSKINILARKYFSFFSKDRKNICENLLSEVRFYTIALLEMYHLVLIPNFI